jgi:hypothetical protein
MAGVCNHVACQQPVDLFSGNQYRRYAVFFIKGGKKTRFLIGDRPRSPEKTWSVPIFLVFPIFHHFSFRKFSHHESGQLLW